MSKTKTAAKNSAGKSSIKRILQDIGDNKGLLAVTLVLTILSKIGLSLAPRISGKITDLLTAFDEAGRFQTDVLLRLSAILVLLYVFGNLMDGFTNKNIVRITERLVQGYRDEASRKINRMPIGYLDTHPAGDILSRLTNDMGNFASSMESVVSSLVGQMALLVFVVIMMVVTNWKLALIYLILLPMNIVVSGMVSKRVRKEFKKQQNVMGDLSKSVQDTYYNHLITQSYACREQKKKVFETYNNEFRRTYTRSRFFAGFMIPLAIVFSNLAYIALCVIGGYMLIQGNLTLGAFLAFTFYGNMVGTPLQSLATGMTTLQTGMASIERIYEFLDEEEMPKEQPTEKLNAAGLEGQVSFEHVKFGYIPEKQLMSDVSFVAKPGMTMAIVGPSGAGKTTLINLLMRFYDIQGGTIRVDGKDIRDLSRDNLRSAFGMVLQDTWIFDGTIADNIAYGKPGATRDDVVAAAKLVQANTFIEKLPDGYDTHISEENSGLSAGEKQLLAIARCVISDPKILILDEATSQVDTVTEYLITKAMEKLMEGRTCFIIAHRLFTIQNADAIIFMMNGDIKEVGSHDELIAKKGYYAEMYAELSDMPA